MLSMVRGDGVRGGGLQKKMRLLLSGGGRVGFSFVFDKKGMWVGWYGAVLSKQHTLQQIAKFPVNGQGHVACQLCYYIVCFLKG